MRSTKCAHCGCGIGFGRTALKCQDCHIVSHTKCMQSISPTCGLPMDFLSKLNSVDSKALERRVSQPSSSTAEVHKNEGNAISGWLKIPKAKGARSGWEKVYVILREGVLSVHNTDVSSKPPPLPAGRYSFTLRSNHCEIVPAVQASDMIHVAQSDLPFVFRVQQKSTAVSFLCSNLPTKQQWVAHLTRALCGGSGDTNIALPSPWQCKPVVRETKLEILSASSSSGGNELFLGTSDGLYKLPYTALHPQQQGEENGAPSAAVMPNISQVGQRIPLLTPTTVDNYIPNVASLPPIAVYQVQSLPNGDIVAIANKRLVVATCDSTLIEYDGLLQGDGSDAPDRKDDSNTAAIYLFACALLDGHCLYIAVAMEDGTLEVLQMDHQCPNEKVRTGESRLKKIHSIVLEEPCSCITIVRPDLIIYGGLVEFRVADFSKDSVTSLLNASSEFLCLGETQISSADFVPVAIIPFPSTRPAYFFLCSPFYLVVVDANLNPVPNFFTSQVQYKAPQTAFCLRKDNSALISISGESNVEILSWQHDESQGQVQQTLQVNRIQNRFHLAEITAINSSGEEKRLIFTSKDNQITDAIN